MRILLVAVAAALGACSDDGDQRTAEIWIVDFDTYGPEVDATLAGLQLDKGAVVAKTLEYLATYFADLPISFHAGISLDPDTTSTICLRQGSSDDEPFGLGIFDPGNAHPVYVCGDRGGYSFGVFIDFVADAFVVQTEGQTYTEPERVDFLGKLLAVVLAHEVGHGIGLAHSTRDYGFGDIMRPPPLAIDGDFFFSAEAHLLLASNLAGR